MNIEEIKTLLKGKTQTDKDLVREKFPYKIIIRKFNNSVFVDCFDREYEPTHTKEISEDDLSIIYTYVGFPRKSLYILYKETPDDIVWIECLGDYSEIVNILQ